MIIVYPHEGQRDILDILFDDLAVISTLYLFLYKNDYTPTVDSEAGSDFDPCDFTGYATKELARGSWTIGRIGLLPTFCYYADQVWTCTATPSPDQYAYGYLLAWYHDSTYYAVAAARLDVPVLVTNGMDITVTPVIVLGDWAGA